MSGWTIRLKRKDKIICPARKPMPMITIKLWKTSKKNERTAECLLSICLWLRLANPR
jgi:hypothetical protein